MNHKLLLDGNNFAKQVFHAYMASPNAHKSTERMAKYGPQEIIYGFLNMLSPLTSGDRKKGVNPGDVIVALDCGTINKDRFIQGNPSWRYDVFPEYKNGIKPRNDPSSRFQSQLVLLPAQLEKFGVKVVSYPQLEGDDIIALLASQLPQGATATICTRDKDLLQCVNSNVHYFNQGTKDHVSASNFANYIGKVFKVTDPKNLQPSELAFVRAIAGDPSDCIPGVPMLGAASAINLVEFLRTKPLTASSLVEHPEHVFELEKMDIPKAIAQHLTQESLSTLQRNIGLMPQHTPTELKNAFLQQVNWDMPKKPNLSEVTTELNALGFSHFVNQLPKWGTNLRQNEVSIPEI